MDSPSDEGLRFTGCQVVVIVGIVLFLAGVCALVVTITSGVAGYIVGSTVSESLPPVPFSPLPAPPTPRSSPQSRSYLGIMFIYVSGGADVVEVIEDSPAERAGLQEGDLIRAVNGQPLTNNWALPDVMAAHEPGDVITLTVERGEETLTLEVELGEGE